MVHSAVLVRDELSALQRATEAANKRQRRKRKYVQNQGSLIMEDGGQLGNPDGAGGVEGSEQPSKKVRAEGGQGAQRRCGNCGKLGHNRRTCTEEVADTK